MRLPSWLSEASPKSAPGSEESRQGMQCFSKTLGGKQEVAEKGWLGGFPNAGVKPAAGGRRHQGLG